MRGPQSAGRQCRMAFPPPVTQHQTTPVPHGVPPGLTLDAQRDWRELHLHKPLAYKVHKAVSLSVSCLGPLGVGVNWPSELLWLAWLTILHGLRDRSHNVLDHLRIRGWAICHPPCSALAGSRLSLRGRLDDASSGHPACGTALWLDWRSIRMKDATGPSEWTN